MPNRSTIHRLVRARQDANDCHRKGDRMCCLCGASLPITDSARQDAVIIFLPYIDVIETTCPACAPKRVAERVEQYLKEKAERIARNLTGE